MISWKFQKDWALGGLQLGGLENFLLSPRESSLHGCPEIFPTPWKEQQQNSELGNFKLKPFSGEAFLETLEDCDLPHFNWFAISEDLTKNYGWWKKSCTGWYGKYPTIYRFFKSQAGCLGFLPSTVSCLLPSFFWLRTEAGGLLIYLENPGDGWTNISVDQTACPLAGHSFRWILKTILCWGGLPGKYSWWFRDPDSSPAGMYI